MDSMEHLPEGSCIQSSSVSAWLIVMALLQSCRVEAEAALPLNNTAAANCLTVCAIYALISLPTLHKASNWFPSDK